MDDISDDLTTSPLQDDDFYSKDLRAEELAEQNMDPDLATEDREPPVTSGDMNIGDLDILNDIDPLDEEYEGEVSEDEESQPGGEDPSGEDDFEAIDPDAD